MTGCLLLEYCEGTNGYVRRDSPTLALCTLPSISRCAGDRSGLAKLCSSEHVLAVVYFCCQHCFWPDRGSELLGVGEVGLDCPYVLVKGIRFPALLEDDSV